MDKSDTPFGQTTPPDNETDLGDVAPPANKFTCKYEDCLKVFKAKKSLIDHSRIHKGEKPYKCSFNPCDKAFTQFSSLQKHERIHKGEKPYICSSCGHSFTQVSNLKRHERSHRGERPHLCDVCSKGFTTSSNLKQHLQTHLQKDTRDKFSCESCGKAYNYNSSLKKHLQEHEGERVKQDELENQDILLFETENNKNLEAIPNIMSYDPINPIIESNRVNIERNWNNYYDFSFPPIPQNNAEIFHGFQRNLLFNGLLQGSIFNRGCGESLNIKRPMDFEKQTHERFDANAGKRLYKHHSHIHSLTCEHLMIIHQGHVDYLHDGMLHHVSTNGGLEEHELEKSDQNPILCKPVRNINPRCSQPAYLSTTKAESCCTSVTTKMPLGNAFENNPNYNSSKVQTLPVIPSIKYSEETVIPELKEENSDGKHRHSEGCEHPMIIHDGHIDYIVEGQLHHMHEDHCDDHGAVYVVNKMYEIQKAAQIVPAVSAR